MIILAVILTVIFSGTMIGFGFLFVKKPPKELNNVFGYRTTYSMKNKNTWEFSHKYAGKVWIYSGILDALVSATILIIFKNSSLLNPVALLMIYVQLVVLIIVIPLTEIALRKTFDKNGNLKKHKKNGYPAV